MLYSRFFLAGAFQVIWEYEHRCYLVISIDLLFVSNARQLLHSLLRYMNSNRFEPKTTIDDSTLSRILK